MSSDPLIFVLAPEATLPTGQTSLSALAAAQAHGPAAGFALRIFSRGALHPDLSRLPLDGRLTGAERRSSDGTQLLCDAVVPLVETQLHWLGVYRLEAGDGQLCRCLDRFALAEASNDTCWFYPTHDGTFLSWECALRLTLSPGTLADGGEARDDESYDRRRIAVLWSLLGDDVSLTCVGVTYGGQRIDWPLCTRRAEPMATWSRLRVDTDADVSLVVEDCLTLFDEPGAAA